MIRMRVLSAALVVAGACGGNPPPTANPQPPVDTAQPAPPPPQAPPPAAPHAEIGEFGFDKTGMDTSGDPTDFYNYANGNWEKLHPMPEDKSDYGNFSVLADKSEERTKEILERAKASSPDEQKIGDYYRSFMDEKAIEDKGAEPLKPMLAEIDGVKTYADVMKELAKLGRIGVNTPINTGVGVDQKDPEHYIAGFNQSGLLLPDRDFYDVKKSQFEKQREAYKKYIVDTFKLAGLDKDADKRAAAVYAFEEQLAKVHWTRKQLRDPVANYNKTAAADLPKLAPGYDWKLFLDGTGLGNEKAIDVGPKAAIIAETKVVKATPIAVLKDYMALHFIKEVAPVLSKKFVDLNFDMFAKTLRGTPQQRVRWKRGVQLTEGALGEAIGKSYVAKYFTPETKAAADKLVANLLASMGKHIDGLTWMTDVTKQKAKAKLATFDPKIGYPKKWRDYTKLEVKAGDAFGNYLRAKEFDTERQLAHLGQPVDRDEWVMTPMTVNAYYSPDKNEIVFPAAILQPPFFDPHADDAINYGGIGAVIGHEISHGFDDQGRQFDDKGALKDWWTKEDAAKFKVYADKLVAQYSAYCPFPGQGNKPALCVDGGLTLGENIADLAGLTISYDAYKTAIGGKEPPVVDGLTGDQRFFLGFAQVWRRSTREAEAKQRLVTDPHSPARFRTSVVRNLDAWYKAFKPEVGKGIALPEDQRVKIW